jgi:hypothetical protein
MTAMNPGAGADIDHVIGPADRVLVMLDDEHRVAEVAQVDEGLEQPLIVALMEPDRRLVQHIEHPGQSRADLRGEPDPLALAARQRARGARQRQIFEPDIVEEFEPVADLLEDAIGDLAILRLELGREPAEPLLGLPDRHRGDLADMQPGDLDGERLRLETIAFAGLAWMVGLVLRQLFSNPGGIRFPPAPLDVAEHALERLVRLVGADPVVEHEGYRLAA